MKDDVMKLISKLDCNGDIYAQEDAIKQLTQIDDKFVSLLVQPMDKKYWENSAKVLKAIGYPKNKDAISGLFQWLKDLNWPGAWTAMETLQSIELTALHLHLESAVKCAIEENDEMWIMALKELAIRRLRLKPSDFKNQEFYNVLDQSE